MGNFYSITQIEFKIGQMEPLVPVTNTEADV